MSGDTMKNGRPFELAKYLTSRVVIYGLLLLWAFICLFPIYWTLTTSFKKAPNVMKPAPPTMTLITPASTPPAKSKGKVCSSTNSPLPLWPQYAAPTHFTAPAVRPLTM